MDQIEALKNHISELEHDLNNARQAVQTATDLAHIIKAIKKSEEKILSDAVARIYKLPHYMRDIDHIVDAIMGDYPHE